MPGTCVPGNHDGMGIIMQSQIRCPDCGNTIHLDTKLLLSGQSFMCTRCALSVSLSAGSHTLVQQAVQGFDRLATMKDDVGKQASQYFKKNRI